LKILIDLDNKTIEKVEKQAESEQRSRKQMLELIIERAVSWLVVQTQNVARCMYETIQDAQIVTKESQRKEWLKFDSSIKKTRVAYCLIPWEYN